AQQHTAHSGAVHLDTQVVSLRMAAGESDQVVAVAEPDLDGAGSAAPEEGREIERLALKLDPVHRPQLLQRALLRFGNAPRAGDERANRPGMRDFSHGVFERVMVSCGSAVARN